MRRIVCIATALLLFCQYSFSQKNITIKGTAVNGENRKVELLAIADQISRAEIILDTFRIGEDKRFDLRCWARYPMMVTLQIENYSQSFYVEPGRDYEVEIPMFDWNLDETRNVFLAPETLPVIFKNIPADDINLLIDSIDRFIGGFIEDNFFFFDQKYKPSIYYYDSLVHELNKHCPDTEIDFVNRYKTYQLAALKYNLKFDTRKNLINKFIKNNPILYYDENYMSLFATLYANSISKGTKDIPIHRLAHWVYNLDLDTYIDSIGIDPLLRHEQVRELAALQALQESYYNFRYYDGEMVIKMIEKLAQRTKFAEHKVIAKNILDVIKKSKSEENNAKSLDFVLPDVDKNPISLNEMKGKWIYISFVRVNDPFSISEIETMAHFKEKGFADSNEVVFVTIACDREFQKMFHFLKNSKHGDRYNWTWLHFDGNYDMLRHFQISCFPWFVLIGPDGSIQYDITPAPSSGFLLNAPWQGKRVEEGQQRELFRKQ
ncbi:MAG: redoxin domain-containing protein [Bacteroidales bacterium]|nr:redoxin domain-containing protein [Bacteroidales bacterium]